MTLMTHLGQPPMASQVRVLWHPSYYYGLWPRMPFGRRWAYASPRRWF